VAHERNGANAAGGEIRHGLLRGLGSWVGLLPRAYVSVFRVRGVWAGTGGPPGRRRATWGDGMFADAGSK
jgi:hypothetical protein